MIEFVLTNLWSIYFIGAFGLFVLILGRCLYEDKLDDPAGILIGGLIASSLWFVVVPALLVAAMFRLVNGPFQKKTK